MRKYGVVSSVHSLIHREGERIEEWRFLFPTPCVLHRRHVKVRHLALHATVESTHRKRPCLTCRNSAWRGEQADQGLYCNLVRPHVCRLPASSLFLGMGSQRRRGAARGIGWGCAVQDLGTDGIADFGAIFCAPLGLGGRCAGEANQWACWRALVQVYHVVRYCL
jgi:hypothetical protein